MGEGTAVLVPLACFLLVVVASVGLSSRARRRREEAFAALAARYGTQVEWLNERSGHFVVKVATRDVAFRDALRTGSQYLTVATTLRGRAWDLHAVDITRRRTTSNDFEDVFTVRDLGMPMREGWLTAAVRGAITESFAPTHSLRKISIEEGQLVFLLSAEPRHLQPAARESLLSALTELATQVERAR